ncbi:peptide chain release factor N(5)-glutamine methyltransferase [Pseudactinotalea sp. HY160]|uniref:peptide chain release factor N(5)-glutamine methyltransferase n=1 Tax=Pseudactinotalea sp. HY160 TaxID=2654490 RepID=UPI0013124389|nr:peptide chain release factor N(5)-glutamine methyltransferase [Pseudactinotalea sp. HY160]
MTSDLPALVRAAAAVLADAGIASPRPDAETLAAHVLGVDRLNLILPPPLPPGFAGAYAELVDRRRRREPLQHLTGRVTFRYLDLLVRPGVFVPRPETEVVAQVAIDAARGVARPLVVDLCTGAGGLALAVATEVPASRVWAIDRSREAVRLTTTNAARVGASPSVVVGDVRDPTLLGELTGRVDVVVSNPPYIPPDAVPVDPEVRDHDPELALYGGGPDGLAVPGAVIAAAARLLRPGGLLVMEHADVQGPRTRRLAAAGGAFTGVHTRPDLTGRDRMLVVTRAGTGCRGEPGAADGVGDY